MREVSCTFDLCQGMGDAVSALGQRVVAAGREIQTLGGYVLTPLGSGAKKVGDYVRCHWQKLFCFGLAWAGIVVGMGVLYGFEAVALNLLIGMGIGSGFGLAFGLGFKFMNWNKSVGGLLNTFLSNTLKSNMTRALVVTIATTILLSASTVFPTTLGIVYGFVLINALTIKILFWDAAHHRDQGTLGVDGEQATLLARVEELEKRLEEFRENGHAN